MNNSFLEDFIDGCISVIRYIGFGLAVIMICFIVPLMVASMAYTFLPLGACIFIFLLLMAIFVGGAINAYLNS